MHSVTSILLVTKARHAAAEATAAAVSQWLEAHGVACSALPADCPSEKLVGRARTSDAILILGGDGTFVGVGRKLAGLDIPLLGINFGQVGFLTELSAVGWEPALERLLAGKMITRTCLLLAWELLRGGTPIASGHAANDVVVGRGAIARVLPVHVFVDGEDMGVVRSDGVIVSTPLGPSPYALSAHGPLVHPKVQALTLTPISPFFKSFPPIVLPADSRIRLETDAAAPDAFLTVDGQEPRTFSSGYTPWFAKTSNSLISILSNLVSSITVNPFCMLFIFTICFVPVIYLRPRIASVIWITRLFSLTSWTRTKEHPFITPITLVAKVPSTR